eukprot:TRINITY_DN35881_c0_g1_i1.p1 TRINITY_DN35881_c0_g1~~TRINITY_DN35881_c0_g1_i1.p1  ORF type:complete len:469 (+),score=64.02 TRINITY_DN35881_c0_g1_i1:152-1558(+)
MKLFYADKLSFSYSPRFHSSSGPNALCKLPGFTPLAAPSLCVPLSSRRSFFSPFYHAKHSKFFKEVQRVQATLSAWGSTSEDSPVQVRPPVPEFDFRSETSAFTREYIESSNPELLDLVDSGSLIVVPRSPTYVERRCDGYQEPEIVYLLGTAHLSRKSAEEVTRLVTAVRPQNVVVELCRSRAGTLYDDVPPTQSVASEGAAETERRPQEPRRGFNVMALSGENFGATVMRSLQLGGRSALALRLLLSSLSARMTSAAGMELGEEFRAARRAAEEVGAQIVLGDRPIEITLQRAWQVLSWREKTRLGVVLVQGATSRQLELGEEVVEALKQDDVLSSMFAKLGEEFPSLLLPLIHERDVYLAWSLKRSKAVNGCQRVVGVIGRGHFRGVVYSLLYDQERLRFRDLVGRRRKAGDSEEGSDSETSGSGGTSSVQSMAKNLLKGALIETAIGFALWIAYTQAMDAWGNR